MCGITGWFSKAPVQPNEVARIGKMVDSIVHRGPDGRGIFRFGNAVLGHARLSIIDLNRGAQPMLSQDGKVAITCNGEIYNFRLLRKELIEKGEKFETESDTEVILRLYTLEGAAGFSRLRGMYAFAIWDDRSKVGILVRDPIGVKPLFYNLSQDGKLIFGSEAKAIIAHTDARPSLNENSLHHLMNLRYLPGEMTMFNGIKQLPPGAILTFSDGRIFEAQVGASDKKAPDDLVEALTESVDLHFTSDVEVACYLSGGVDSATVLALAGRSGHKSLRTFTLKVGDDPNEADYAKETANILGATNIQGDEPSDLLNSFPRLIWSLEVPKVNSIQVNRLAALTAKHVKVALSGLGGDELFLGYNAHSIMSKAVALDSRAPRFITNQIGELGASMIRAVNPLINSELERQALMAQSLGDWSRVYALLRNVWDSEPLRRKIYGPRMLDTVTSNVFDTVSELWPDEKDPVMAMARFEWKQKMVNDLLWQEDRASMAEGLEVRVPFVDTVLADKIFAMNRSELTPGGVKKGYLKNKLSHALLPDSILNRPKSGFQVDAPRFFNDKLAGLAQIWLNEKKIKETALFNPAFVKYVTSLSERRNVRWHYFMLYLMIGAQIWVEIFERGETGLIDEN